MTGASTWWFKEYSAGMQNYEWFQKQLQTQNQKNVKLLQKNQQLRKEITALRYDHRLIEREARDLLTFTREGEIVVHLPR
jgi:cell division protein FtsB